MLARQSGALEMAVQDEAPAAAAAAMAGAAAAIQQQLRQLSLSVAPAESIETEPAPMRTADDIIFALRGGGYATIDIKGPKAKAIRCVWAGRSALRCLCSCHSGCDMAFAGLIFDHSTPRRLLHRPLA